MMGKKSSKSVFLSLLLFLLFFLYLSVCLSLHTHTLKMELVVLREAERFRNYVKNNGIPLDINARLSKKRHTLLHFMSRHNIVDMAQAIIEYPGTDVNVTDSQNRTPLLIACRETNSEIIQLLAKDKRTDFQKCDKQGRTPLWTLARYGREDLIIYLIASGKPLNPMQEGACEIEGSHDALHIAAAWGRRESTGLIYMLCNYPVLTTHNVRVKLGCKEQLAADLFSVVVFVSDNLLTEKQNLTRSSNKRVLRFLKITRRLPMEMQMIVCNMAVDLKKDSIPSQVSEPAFLTLAMRYSPTYYRRR